MIEALQLAGLLLWRGGLLVAGGWAIYETLSRILQFFDLPQLAQAGLGLSLTGCVLVVISVVLERIADARAEGDLTQ